MSDKDFNSIQRIGATGFLRGKGQPNAWANRTWFEPDSTLFTLLFIQDLSSLQFQNAAGKTQPFLVESSLEKINKEKEICKNLLNIK